MTKREKIYRDRNPLKVDGVSNQAVDIFRGLCELDCMSSPADVFEQAILAFHKATTPPDVAERDFRDTKRHHDILRKVAIRDGYYEPN